MLQDLFPRRYGAYLSLPILGCTLEGFADYLFTQGYPRKVIRLHLRAIRKIAERLQKRRCRSMTDVTREVLRECAPAPGRAGEDPSSSAVVRLLEMYFSKQGVLRSATEPTRVQERIAEYARYLTQVRGLSASTIKSHFATASQLFALLDARSDRESDDRLTGQDVEAFVRSEGKRVSRATLQHTVSHVRSVLRFLATRSEVPVGLDSQIDTPRVYREERLPRSLPWATVQSFLSSIDRSIPMGRRDYAMFQLIANYGLRAGEVVSLTLDDIQWRSARLVIHQRKSARELVLPLTTSVGESLVNYLRQGRPPSCHREVFLRHRAPAGILKPTAVTEAFQKWASRSGLPIPFQNCHCLRHSYAVHLLRQGTPLKTIGDLLGHRSAESTCVYLRLAVEDLRQVALDLPADALQEVTI